MSDTPHIAVVGGGITGLAAAHALLARDGHQPRVTLLEADGRLGGKIRSVRFAGTIVEAGPEALLTAMPAALALCQELGLADELVAPLQSGSSVWTRGQLRELPLGILGGLPEGLGPILRSGLLTPAGIVRAGADLVLPRRNSASDQSVGALVRYRLGRQALERMVDPLLGGIYGGDPDRLSARATAPRLVTLAQEHRSLIRGLLRAGSRTPPPDGPMFVTLPGGLERLVARLGEDVRAQGEVRLGSPVTRLSVLPGNGYRLELGAGPPLRADGVILALPAFAAGTLLARSAPGAAAALHEIEYRSADVAWLAFPSSALPGLPRGTGFLVPRAERRTLAACTWGSAKWPHLAQTGQLLLRCSLRPGEPGAPAPEEGQLLERALSDLRATLGLRAEPDEVHLTRWNRGLPQYTVGHFERVERIEAELAALPHVAVAGAAYRGLGVPQCIAQGQATADRVARLLLGSHGRSPSPAPS